MFTGMLAISIKMFKCPKRLMFRCLTKNTKLQNERTVVLDQNNNYLLIQKSSLTLENTTVFPLPAYLSPKLLFILRKYVHTTYCFFNDRLDTVVSELAMRNLLRQLQISPNDRLAKGMERNAIATKRLSQVQSLFSMGNILLQSLHSLIL